MNKKEVARTILENLTNDEIEILALEAIERRMKSHDQAGSANSLLNRIMPNNNVPDFSKFLKNFKESYQYRKEDRQAAKADSNYKLSPVFVEDGRI